MKRTSSISIKSGPDISIGSRVLTGTGFTKRGEVCFIGETKFSTGEWVGVKLDTPDGKNDGSVGDVKYFEAPANHGLFVKRSQIKLESSSDQKTVLSTKEKLAALKEKRSNLASKRNSIGSSSNSRSSSTSDTQAMSPKNSSSGNLGSRLPSKTSIKSTEMSSRRQSISTKPSSSRSSNSLNNSFHDTNENEKVDDKNEKSLEIKEDKISETLEETSKNADDFEKIQEDPEILDLSESNQKSSLNEEKDIVENVNDPITDVTESAKQAIDSSVLEEQDHSFKLLELETSYKKKSMEDEEKINRLMKELNEIKFKHSSMEDNVAKINSEMVLLNKENSDLSGKLADLEKSHQNLSLENNDLRSKSEKLEADLVKKNKMLAELEDRQTSASNTNGSKIKDLEDQITELNDHLESLTLDKESLIIERDTLEEKYLQLQIDYEESLNEIESLQQAASTESIDETQINLIPKESIDLDASSSNVEIEIRYNQLKSENDQLREALFRLNKSSQEESRELESLKKVHQEMAIECNSLREFKMKATEDLEQLRSTVDSMSSYEDMIESLSSQNLELSNELKEQKEIVSELEDAQEVYEELDLNQRQQIESDRKAIDHLNISIDQYTRQLETKEQEITDLLRNIEKLKNIISADKLELDKLRQNMSSESNQFNELQVQIRETKGRMFENEILAAQVDALQYEVLNQQLQKNKFQSICSHLDAIFGGSSIYLEESKYLNNKVYLITSLNLGFDALQYINLIFSAANDFQIDASSKIENLPENEDPVDLTSNRRELIKRLERSISVLYMIIVQAQSFILQSSLDLVLNQSQSSYDKNKRIQIIIQLKSLFERALSIVGKDIQLNSLANILQDSNKIDSIISSISTLGLGFNDLLSDDNLSIGKSSIFPSSVYHSLKSFAFSRLKNAHSVHLSFEIEMMICLLNHLCDVAYVQIKQQTSPSSSEETQLPEENSPNPVVENASDGLDADLQSLSSNLKSIKVELRSLVSAFKSSYKEVVGNKELIESSLSSLFLVFDDNFIVDIQAPHILSNIKASLSQLRMLVSKASTISKTHMAPITFEDLPRNCFYFYPKSVLTSINDSQLRNPTEMRHLPWSDNSDHIGKFWALVSNSSIDVLLPTKEESLSQEKNPLKQRISDVRNIVMERLGTHEETSDHKKTVLSDRSQSIIRVEEHEKLKNEFNLLSEKLQLAIKKNDELNGMINTFETSQKNLQSNANEINRLRDENKTLQEALEQTEKRVDETEKELKNIRSHQHPMKSSDSKKIDLSVATNRMPRKKSTIDSSEITNFFNNIGKITPEVAKASNVASGLAKDSVNTSSSTIQHYLDQILYWKAASLRQVSHSLLNIPLQDSSKTNRRIQRSINSEENQSTGYQFNSFSKIQVFNRRKSDVEVDHRANYHDLRMTRARGLKIKPINPSKRLSSHVGGHKLMNSKFNIATPLSFRILNE